MADNVTVDNVALTDYVVATDDDGTAQHQYVKLEFGADNTQTKVSASNPLPVTGTALSGTVAVSSLAAGTNFLGTVANAGTVAVGSLPSGTPFLGTVANAGTVAISSIVAALPTGSNFIGTVANAGTVAVSSLAAGTNFLGTVANAGTVAVSSIVAALPTGSNFIGTVANAGTVAVASIATNLNFIGTVANAGTVAVSSIVSALPTGSNFLGTVANAGTVSVNTIANALPAGANTLGTVITKEIRSSTGTLSHVNPATVATGLLNVNTSRLGLSVANDARGDLYLSVNGNASTTDYTVRISQYQYWEAPFNWTGTVTGLWSTVIASDGAARITEYS